jgi:hypothetical protein
VVKHINMTTSEPLKSAPAAPGEVLLNPHESPWPLEALPSSSERNPNPGRLFDTRSSVVKATPPRAFLSDLQRVMQKKWAVAQKFHFTGTGGHHHHEAVAAERFANHYKEQDVSYWILSSLKHSHIRETDMSQDLYDMNNRFLEKKKKPPSTLNIPHENRPKIYNGRSVPNCYPPDKSTTTNTANPHQVHSLPGPSDPRFRIPPTPPRRSGATQLTSPR